MRIGRVRTEVDGAKSRAEAEVVWEDADRGAWTLFFEVARPAGAPPIDANAFLAAAAIPAIRSGERRIAVDGAVCPRLRDGVEAAAGLLRSWYGAAATPAIEPSAGFSAPRPPSSERSGVFLSGGLDSIYGVWWNRRNLPTDHPRAFREALRIRHFMFPADPGPERRAHVEIRSARAVAAIARAAGLEIREVATNALRLDDDFSAYATWTHGSVLAACGIAAGPPLTDVTISASHDVWAGILPWGSHPLLDPQFSTAALAVHHDGIGVSRMEKAAAVGGWREVLEALYVCEAGPFEGDAVNCGSCEKCVRTRVALLLGAGIEEPPTFPGGPVTAEAIEAMPHLAGFRRQTYYWEELGDAARRAGRTDLAAAIERMIDRRKRIDAWTARRGWKGRLRELDERYLGSTLLRARRRWSDR